MTERELKPCPFCGAIEIEVTVDFTEFYGSYYDQNSLPYYAQCSQCFSRTNGFGDEQFAIESWNMRYDDKTKGEV
jgi:Lar family restriction alleviation protein